MYKYVDLIFLKISIGYSYFSNKQGISYDFCKFIYFLKYLKTSYKEKEEQ
jgi:hypothetical protein